MVRIFKNVFVSLGLLLVSVGFPCVSHATDFALPTSNDALIGDVQYISITSPDRTANVAQHFNLGLNAIVDANPGVGEGSTLPTGSTVKIATQFLLPPMARKGIVINLSEMRMYYYPKGKNVVMTFPIGIGKIGKTIPVAATSIVRKVVNPVWIPPADIRQFNKDQGIELPAVMEAGPDNPLGPYAIYLRIPTFLIHSTIFPESIGRRASFGCIRMNETDIKEFFPLVEPGTPVMIIDMPNKVGWAGNELYLEAHPPLIENDKAFNASNEWVTQAIEGALPSNHVTLVNWQLVSYLTAEPDGVPHVVAVQVN